MFVTIADEKLIAVFSGARNAIEVRANDGRILGVFTPGTAPPEPSISEDELKRLEDPKTGQWYTAAQVEARLRELR